MLKRQPLVLVWLWVLLAPLTPILAAHWPEPGAFFPDCYDDVIVGHLEVTTLVSWSRDGKNTNWRYKTRAR